jgi:hypothetical protein
MNSWRKRPTEWSQQTWSETIVERECGIGLARVGDAAMSCSPPLSRLERGEPTKDEWFRFAECSGCPTNWWFPPFDNITHANAVSICRRCRVKDECLAFAVADPELLGIWGGASERQRQRVRVGGLPLL